MGMVILGIDPGLAGGVAVCHEGKMTAYNMPQTYTDIFDFFEGIVKAYAPDEVVAFLEDVGHGMPGQSSKATATFARHCGYLEMALYALKVRTYEVKPQKWQKAYSNTLGKSSQYEKREWKNRLKQLAQQMYPGLKVTLKTADAILIAEYGRKNL